MDKLSQTLPNGSVKIECSMRRKKQYLNQKMKYCTMKQYRSEATVVKSVLDEVSGTEHGRIEIVVPGGEVVD